ncbi:MAG: hypothetical protein QMC77_03240 [Methanocellales archaeon]|nr:hypothetical protein [Methanocellales archaeon]
MSVMSVRIPDDIMEYVSKKAKSMRLDKSSMARMLLVKGVEETKKEEAVEQYKKGKMTLLEAARYVGVDIYTMAEMLIERGVYSSGTEDTLEKSFKMSKEVSI